MSFFNSHWRNSTSENSYPTLSSQPLPAHAKHKTSFSLCCCWYSRGSSVTLQYAHPSFFSSFMGNLLLLFFKSTQQRKGPLSHTAHIWRDSARRGRSGLSRDPRTRSGAFSHLTEVSDCCFTMVLGKLQHKLWLLPTLFQWYLVLTASTLSSEQASLLVCHTRELLGEIHNFSSAYFTPASPLWTLCNFEEADWQIDG